MPSEVWYEITDPFLNFNAAIDQQFRPTLYNDVFTYPCWD